MSAVRVCLILRAELAQANLRCREPHGCEADWGVLTGVETILDDGHEAYCEACLIVKRGLTLGVAIECDVGDRGVLGDGLAHISERKIRCNERIARGADVVVLREVEEQRLRGEVEDGGLTHGEAVGVAKA